MNPEPSDHKQVIEMVTQHVVTSVQDKLQHNRTTVSDTPRNDTPQNNETIESNTTIESGGQGQLTGMGSVAELDSCLNSFGVKWYHTGGYAMLRWLRHYQMDEIGTQDLDIMIESDSYEKVFLALHGKPANKVEEKHSLEGYAVTLHSYSGDVERYFVDNAPLVSPKKLADNYGTGSEQEEKKVMPPRSGLLQGIKARRKDEDVSVKTEQELQEEKEKQQRRETRRNAMSQLLHKFTEEGLKPM